MNEDVEAARHEVSVNSLAKSNAHLIRSIDMNSTMTQKRVREDVGEVSSPRFPRAPFSPLCNQTVSCARTSESRFDDANSDTDEFDRDCTSAKFDDTKFFKIDNDTLVCISGERLFLELVLPCVSAAKMTVVSNRSFINNPILSTVTQIQMLHYKGTLRKSQLLEFKECFYDYRLGRPGRLLTSALLTNPQTNATLLSCVLFTLNWLDVSYASAFLHCYLLECAERAENTRHMFLIARISSRILKQPNLQSLCAWIREKSSANHDNYQEIPLRRLDAHVLYIIYLKNESLKNTLSQNNHLNDAHRFFAWTFAGKDEEFNSFGDFPAHSWVLLHHVQILTIWCDGSSRLDRDRTRRLVLEELSKMHAWLSAETTTSRLKDLVLTRLVQPLKSLGMPSMKAKLCAMQK